MREPELLRGVGNLQERMDGLAGVGRRLTLLETVRVLNRDVHSDDPDEERSPATRAGVTELLFMIGEIEKGATLSCRHSDSSRQMTAQLFLVRPRYFGRPPVSDAGGRVGQRQPFRPAPAFRLHGDSRAAPSSGGHLP